MKDTQSQITTMTQTTTASTTTTIAERKMKTTTTQMPNTTRNIINIKKDRAIVIDERLITSPLSNSFVNLLLINHDIYHFKMYNESDKTISARKMAKPLFDLNQAGYKKLFFIGYRQSTDLFYELYRLKKFSFDSAVLLNCLFDFETTMKMKKDFIDTNYLIINRKLEEQCHMLIDGDDRFMYQSIPTLLPFTHSPRVAQEALGWLEYKNTPSENYTSSVGSLQNLI